MKTLRYAFARTLPIMAGYLVLGLGFGVLLQSKGYGVGWSLAMSTLIYAGSMQYVTIDLLAGGASLISAALMTLMVNARRTGGHRDPQTEKAPDRQPAGL